MDELYLRTDMNIKGRLIEELEHIPNIVQNISSLPKLNDNIEKINLKFEVLEERIVSIDKRLYSIMLSNDKLDLSFVNLNENFEDIKAENLEYNTKFSRIEDRLKLFASKDLFESYRKDIQRNISEILKEMEGKSEYKLRKSSLNNNSVSNIDVSMFIKEDVYYNEKIEMQTNIQTLYNSFDEFKESLSNVTIKNMIKEQFLKVAVLLSDFNAFKIIMREKHEKYEKSFEELLKKH